MNQPREVVADALPDVEQQARELLAREYERDRVVVTAQSIRSAPVLMIDECRAIRAIVAALRTPAKTGGGGEIDTAIGTMKMTLEMQPGEHIGLHRTRAKQILIALEDALSLLSGGA